MYQYNAKDKQFVQARVDEFANQVARYENGELDEDEFKQLRLRNGLYYQRHAYMLRVAIPYGVLSSKQLHTLGDIAKTYDKGYGHFTTRQNIQYNWPELSDVPKILQDLANVDMHAIQTSGNCIRNTTTDPLAGAVADEIEDPRPWCELIRQWSTLHPEFNWLPRKFKIAVTGSLNDRAAVQVHDIGLRLIKNERDEIGFEVLVGGGLGRTPYIGSVIKSFLPKQHLLTYLNAILRIYNQAGRRDNLYKARIKILVNAMGIESFTNAVDEEWALSKNEDDSFTQSQIDELKAQFPSVPTLSEQDPGKSISGKSNPGKSNSGKSNSGKHDPGKQNAVDHGKKAPPQLYSNPLFNQWYQSNTRAHRDTGRRIVFVSLKSTDAPAGDATCEQMQFVAKLAENYSESEIRTTHEQNLVLPHVPVTGLYELWQLLGKQKLATPNIGKLSDMIVCPGLDFCSLANAGTYTIYDQINARFDDLDYQHDLGDLSIKISGCMNACGHHHVGDIGILGVEKGGVEWYQLTLGGHAGNKAALGKRLGKAIPKDEVSLAIKHILDTFIEQRVPEERFNDTFERVGIEPFKEKVYAVAA